MRAGAFYLAAGDFRGNHGVRRLLLFEPLLDNRLHIEIIRALSYWCVPRVFRNDRSGIQCGFVPSKEVARRFPELLILTDPLQSSLIFRESR